jgi:hypothetical protein
MLQLQIQSQYGQVQFKQTAILDSNGAVLVKFYIETTQDG